tara:strand:+ start:119 stop:592 length:474 start_codon:yes stop_codon:yes gene_type:complete
MSGIVADNSARASGVVAAAGAGGKVLQVVTASIANGNGTTTSSSFVAMGTDCTIDITPTKDDSRIMILSPISCYAGHQTCIVTVYRDSTNVAGGTAGVFQQTSPMLGVGIAFVDSPATTSATTYNLRLRASPGGTGATVYAQQNYTTTMTLVELAPN